jgi:hypothetical protein
MTIHDNAERGPWLKPGITERLEELHAVLGMGELSMGEIANRLSDEFGATVTRNAVIGRCRRQGLPKRMALKWSKPAPPRKRKKRRPRRRLVIDLPPILPVEPAPPNGTPLTIYQLNDKNCHWPLGPVDDRPPYLFCGKPAVHEGCPWCGEHYDEAHGIRRERVAA